MERIELTSRWDKGAGESSRVQIARALQKQEPISLLTPFEPFQGRADLRGFHEPTLRGIRGASLSRVDLSASNLDGVRMTDCILAEVKFNRASLRDLVDEANRFDSCEFTETSFRGSSIGARPSQFMNCTFTRCDFFRLRFGQAEFDNCRFDACQLQGVDFGASSFVDVAFSGTLDDVWFRGRDPFLAFTEGPAAQRRINEMIRVSFAAAQLKNVTFSDNCPLSQVTLPKDGNSRLLDRWPERIAASLESIAGWNDPVAWNYVAAYLPHSKTQSEYIVNRSNIVETLGNEVGDRVFATLQLAIN